jgi:hypothetical protein
VVLMLECGLAPAVEVYFEPWGAQHTLVQGDRFRVEIVGPVDGAPEISHTPGGLSIWAWSGATTRVWNKAGDELPT